MNRQALGQWILCPSWCAQVCARAADMQPQGAQCHLRHQLHPTLSVSSENIASIHIHLRRWGTKPSLQTTALLQRARAETFLAVFFTRGPLVIKFSCNSMPIPVIDKLDRPAQQHLRQHMRSTCSKAVPFMSPNPTLYPQPSDFMSLLVMPLFLPQTVRIGAQKQFLLRLSQNIMQLVRGHRPRHAYKT